MLMWLKQVCIGRYGGRHEIATPTIAYFCAGAFVGGAERSLALLIQEVGRRYKVCVFADPVLHSQLQRPGVECVSWSMQRLSKRTFLRFCLQSIMVAGQLRRRRVALLHANELQAVFCCWLAAKLACVPMIAHNRALWGVGDFSRVMQAAIRSARRIVCISKAVEQNLVSLIGPLPTTVVYNAMDVESFAVGRAQMPLSRRDLGIKEDAVVVGMASRVVADKEQLLMVEAAVTLKSLAADVHYLIVGSIDCMGTTYYETLKQRIAEHGLSASFTFTGHVDDVAPYLQVMDVFVLTSRWEAFGRVLIEAMAVRKPIVAARSGGVPEIVEDGETGLLFAPGDSSDLARCLKMLIDDPIRRNQLGLAGHEVCTTRFSLRGQMQHMFDLYKKELSAIG